MLFLLSSTMCIFVGINLIYPFDAIENYNEDIQIIEDIDLETSYPLDPKTGYAIVVGISNYPGSSSDLQYCDDDAQDIRSMLINDYNFKSENIIYLQDSAATKSAINNAFDTVASQIDSNDIFFFSYSGHGGFGTEYGPYSITVESPHNYPNDYDNTWSISHTGAAYMRVHFYRLSTEYDYDFLLCGDSDVASGYYYELYSGNYGYNFWSAYIPVDRYYIRLLTDLSVTSYGFRIDSYEVIMDDGTHYLCPYDSIPDSPSNFYLDTLIDSKLDSINCEQKYVILDSCNSGGVIPEVQSSGRYVMTASEADEYSLEDSARQNGCFTYNFLEGPESATDSNGDGVISMEEIYDYAYSTTVTRSGALGYTHHPQESDGITGESVLETGFGNLLLLNSSNELDYSFYMYGIGEIKNLTLTICNVNATDVIYQQENLLLTAISETGFEYYNGTSILSGSNSINGYALIAEIQENELITLENSVSGDYDNDTIEDIIEIYYNLSPNSVDSDSDGLNDTVEFYGDTNPILNDTDGDGLLDGEEVLTYFTNATNSDSDGDGLSDYLEIIGINTDATNSDSDGDGMGDGYEYYNNLNYTIDDSYYDYDFDGLTNIDEFFYNSNPHNADTDGDGLMDGLEVNVYGTDVLNPDSDGDGYTDGLEVAWGLNPLDPRSTMLTIFLNIGGIALLIVVGTYSTRAIVVHAKQKTKNAKKYDGSIKSKGVAEDYNALKVEEKTNVKPTPSYGYYRQPSYQQRPQTTAIPSNMTPAQLKTFFYDFIQNRLPRPFSKNELAGQKAMVIGNLALKAVQDLRVEDALNYIFTALKMGIPEPMNSQFKRLLISLVEGRFEPSGSRGYQPTGPSHGISPGTRICSNCGKVNTGSNKFCTQCGRSI